MLSPFKNSLLSIASLGAAIVFANGCSSNNASPNADAGVDGAVLTAEQVPALRLMGDIASCPAGFEAAPEAGTKTGFQSGGQNRSFQLILPDETFAGPRPLFIAFNGTGETGPSFSQRARLREFAARGFIVLAPSSNMNGTVWPIWDDMRQPTDHERANLDVAYVDQLLSCMSAHFEIDKNRLYVGGHSAGGIFTNAYVQRRSSILAGAIAASGIIDLTAPVPAQAIDPLFVIVTWGGPTDSYSGGQGITVPQINFTEQAALTTQFYAEEGHATQVNCHPPQGIGHAWLPMNDWFIDRLLEHPKGVSKLATDLPQATDPRFSCSSEIFVAPTTAQIECPASTAKPACQQACQNIADCGAENATVGPVIQSQLNTLGIRGNSCTACVSKCETDASTAEDDGVLACINNAIASNMCGAGIAGFSPWSTAVNSCCEGHTSAPYCKELCRVLNTNSAAQSFFPVCASN